LLQHVVDGAVLTCVLVLVAQQPPAENHPLSLHDALPISHLLKGKGQTAQDKAAVTSIRATTDKAADAFDQAAQNMPDKSGLQRRDRKSTRLNSSHSQISYAVFCLKKNKAEHRIAIDDGGK